MKKKTQFSKILILLILCLVFGFWGICKAYENTRLIGFGEHGSAVGFGEGERWFFDYGIKKEF